MPATIFSGALAREFGVVELAIQIGDLFFELLVFLFEACAVHGDIELHREGGLAQE